MKSEKEHPIRVISPVTSAVMAGALGKQWSTNNAVMRATQGPLAASVFAQQTMVDRMFKDAVSAVRAFGVMQEHPGVRMMKGPLAASVFAQQTMVDRTLRDAVSAARNFGFQQERPVINVIENLRRHGLFDRQLVLGVGTGLTATALHATTAIDFKFTTRVSTDWLRYLDDADSPTTGIDKQFAEFAETRVADYPGEYDDRLDVLAKNEPLMENVAEYWGLSWPPRSAAGQQILASIAAFTIGLALFLGWLAVPHIIEPVIITTGVIWATYQGVVKWSENARRKIDQMDVESRNR